MTYIPRQGDLAVLNFAPQTGREQGGRRPCFVISNEFFYRKTGLAVVCPITRTDNRFPLHVKLDERTVTKGVILCEQTKSLDVKARGLQFVERAPKDITEEVRDIVLGFFD